MILVNSPWFENYKKLSEALQRLYRKGNNPSRRLYEAVCNDTKFTSTNKWIMKFSSLRSLDPVHIFSAISANNQKDSARTEKILNVIDLINHEIEQVYMSEVQPSTFYEIDYTGCPAPPAIHSLSLRDTDKQKEIWEAFISIYEKEQDCDLELIFEKSKTWYGVSHRLLTMFMFWVSPYNFLPLDRNTVSFLDNNLEGFKEPKTGRAYRELLKYKSSPVYKDIAVMSYSPDSYKSLENVPEYERYFGKESTDLKTKRHNFKILAIKPLTGCNPKNLKSLAEEQLYKLDKNFHLDEMTNIEYKEDFNIYSLNSMSLNFSAIVGKNGTGKSTLAELFIACINNVAFKVFSENSDVKLGYVDSLFAELYFYSDELYKFELKGNDIRVITYEEIKEGVFYKSEEAELLSLKFDSLFYSLLVNYSLHGLNQRYYENDWLEKLFHKNDGYQTPIVIEPYRKNGTIDINVQDELVKTRLIHNLLSPSGSDDSFRVLKRSEKKDYHAHSFKLCNNHSKIKDIKREYKRADSRDEEGHFLKLSDIVVGDLIEDLFREFECEDKVKTLDDYGRNYLLRKLLLITLNNNKYYEFFNLVKGEYKFLKTKKFIKAIRNDTSHRVAKLRRAINHYKFSLYNSTAKTYIITEVSQAIEEILNESGDAHLHNKLPEDKLEFLLPPSFYYHHIYLEDETEFSSLSSGEKQIAYSLNSLTYHLRNLDSVLIESERAKYNFVNIFLDEIELCFHPELQRIYLNELYKTLKRFDNESEHINGINICFITHSPFVLSDIPDSNVLFLTHHNKYELLSVPFESTTKTFAANIHDLLNDGFFVSSTIGAFAERCIKCILDFDLEVQQTDLSNEESKKKLEEKFHKEANKFRYIISSLGDSYIKPIMESHFMAIVERLGLADIKSNFKEEKIKALEQELKLLRSDENA